MGYETELTTLDRRPFGVANMATTGSASTNAFTLHTGNHAKTIPAGDSVRIPKSEYDALFQEVSQLNTHSSTAPAQTCTSTALLSTTRPQDFD